MTHTALETRPTSDAADHARMLQQTLVELIDLALQGKQAHWNVVGPAFKPLHEQLDEMVLEYRAWYDEVAERLAALGVAPDGRSTTVSAATPLPQLPAGQLADHEVLAQFDERVGLIAGAVRERAVAIGDEDLPSQDMLIGIAAGLEKQLWMIRAQRA
jgi:starvation-inducible DNA-binding protein